MDWPVLIPLSNNSDVIQINSNEFSIGRALNNSYILKELCISRNHCVFRKEANTWIVYDQSSNGTRINSELIHKNARPIGIQHNDTVELTDTIKYKFRYTDEKDEYDITAKRRRLNNYDVVTTEKIPINTINQNEVLKTVDCTSPKLESVVKKGDLVREKAINKKLKDESHLMQDQIIELQVDLFNKISTNVKLEQENLELKSNCAVLEKEKEELQMQLTDSECETSLLKLKVDNFNISDKSNTQTGNSDEEDQKLYGCVLRAEIFDKECCVKSKIIKAVHQLKNVNTKTETSEPLKTVEKHLFELQTDIDELIVKRNELEHSTIIDRRSTSGAKVKQDVYDMLDADLQCSICNELFIKATTLNCSHMFCKMCILRWQRQKKTCPICRVPITDSLQSIPVDNLIDQLIDKMCPDKKEIRAKLKETYETAIQAGASSSETNAASRNARHTTIYVSSDESDDSDTDFDEDFSDNSHSDSYFGGYGLCFICGDPSHWANNCPQRRRH